jgi:rod shape-determining protein MreC
LNNSRGTGIWLVVLCSLVIIGFVLARTGDLPAGEGALLRVFVPAEEGLGHAGSALGDIFTTVSDLRDLRDENAALADIANELAVENTRLEELEAENELLRRLLNFVDSSPERSTFHTTEVRARVVGFEPSDLLQYIIISAGQEDGIAPEMPVVTERGLVGRVEEVFPNAARVRLIIDAGSSVNALVQRTRATGVVQGQAGGQLLLDYLPQGSDVVAVGDKILTSGLGGGYPRQLVIGEVTSVDQKDYGMFQQASVRPTVDFNRLEIVLVITDFIPLKMEPAAGPDGLSAVEP